MHVNAVFIITLFFGIWFTILTATAWTRGRRVAALVLGVLAAVDLGIALETLQR